MQIEVRTVNVTKEQAYSIKEYLINAQLHTDDTGRLAIHLLTVICDDLLDAARVGDIADYCAPPEAIRIARIEASHRPKILRDSLGNEVGYGRKVIDEMNAMILP